MVRTCWCRSGWRLRGGAVLGVCLSVAIVAHAQDSLPPPTAVAMPALSLGDLENLALAHNPTIPQAVSLVQQDQGQLRQAQLYPNPVAGYIRGDPDQSGVSKTAGVFLSQEIITAGKRRLAQAIDREEISMHQWQVQAQQARVLNDVRIRYYEALGAQEAEQSATELVSLAEEAVKATAKRVEAKKAARVDVLQAEIQLQVVQTTLQAAQFRRQASWHQLATVIGLPELPPGRISGNLAENIPVLDWQQSLQYLLESSPLLRAQEAEIRSAQNTVRYVRAQAVPNVNVQVLAQRDSVAKASTVSTLVSLPVPLINRNQGNIATAEGLLRQQQMEYERLKLALTDQLTTSFRQYLTLRAQEERMHKEVLPRVKENLELTMKGYQAGQLDVLRVLVARHSYFQTTQNHIDTLTELHKVAIEIQGLQLTGALNPTEIGTALQAGGGTSQRSVLLEQLQQQHGQASQNLPGAIQGSDR